MFERTPLIIKLTFGLLFAILLVYALIETRDFLYPLAFAILLSYLLYPISKRWEQVGIPRILANIFSILFFIFVVLSASFIISKQMTRFLDDLPAIQDQALKNVDTLEVYIEDKFGIPVERQDLFLRQSIENLITSSGSILQNLVSATAGTVVKFALIPVYVFFLLFYRNKFKAFFLKLVPPDKHSKAELIIWEISSVTKRYMVGVVIVILILCVLNSVGLLIIGLKYALLLGILSAIMNFIPYFGTLIGGAIPLTFALLIEGSIETAFYVVILFLIIQFTENNILTPNITGGQVSINPFMTILSIIIGGMIWGLPGMFVSVPFLGMFKIICDHVEKLHPISYLLSTKGAEDHTVNFSRVKLFFKRIRNKG